MQGRVLVFWVSGFRLRNTGLGFRVLECAALCVTALGNVYTVSEECASLGSGAVSAVHHSLLARSKNACPTTGKIGQG
jgi:hypothetical protein